MPGIYKLTNEAVSDLTRIWEYTIEKWSERQAEKYYSALIESFKAIADNPELGKKYIDINPDLWGFKINRHIIFYRKFGDLPIEVTRILHERMDLKNRLND